MLNPQGCTGDGPDSSVGWMQDGMTRGGWILGRRCRGFGVVECGVSEFGYCSVKGGWGYPAARVRESEWLGRGVFKVFVRMGMGWSK